MADQPRQPDCYSVLGKVYPIDVTSAILEMTNRIYVRAVAGVIANDEAPDNEDWYAEVMGSAMMAAAAGMTAQNANVEPMWNAPPDEPEDIVEEGDEGRLPL